MRIEDMVGDLERRGFFTYVQEEPITHQYSFTIIKDNIHAHAGWLCPSTPDPKKIEESQRNFLRALVAKWNYNAVWLEYYEEDVKLTNVVKNLVNSKFGVGSKPKIKNVHFNPPMTIVIWTDGTKTFVKAHNEMFDPEKGLAMAITKKFIGDNKYDYIEEINKWVDSKMGPRPKGCDS